MNPLFVGGVGASGTNMVMRVLIKHPRVMGEMLERRWCDPSNQVAVPPLDMERVRAVLEAAQFLYGDYQYWVEKSPESAAWFDMIHSAAPTSQLIHAYCHPLTNLMAIQAKLFPTTSWRYWCASLEENAQRIAWLYTRVEVQEAAGYPILHVAQEELARLPATVIKRLYQKLELGDTPYWQRFPPPPLYTLSRDERAMVAPILQSAIRLYVRWRGWIEEVDCRACTRMEVGCTACWQCMWCGCRCLEPHWSWWNP